MDNKTNEESPQSIELQIAIRSINHVTDQLCKARDDTYHRARAEAERDAYLKIIKEMYRGLLDEIIELRS
jgi:hypothetical protein